MLGSMKRQDAIKKKEMLQRNLAVNPINSYPRSVLKQVYLLSAQKPKRQAKAHIFGSYLYRFQKYPGDVDMMEEYDCESCNTEDDVVKKFFISLKKIINNVIKQKEEYYSEIKCGIDERFNLDFGKPLDGIWNPPEELSSDVFYLYEDGFLPKQDFEIISTILHKELPLNSNDYDVVKNILRNYYILRWTTDEVLKNKKILPGNVIFKFTDGLRMDSLVKIDVITIINSRVVETTNVYYLAYKDGNEFHHLQRGNVPDQLKDEIEKLYYSDMFYSPFKMVKRIYAYSRLMYNKIQKDIEKGYYSYSWEKKEFQDILNSIIPFLGGDESYLYQLKSELDTIVLLLEKFKNPSPKAIFNTIDEMKIRISKILFFNDAYVTNLCSLLDFANKQKNNDNKIEILEEVIDLMKKAINFRTINFLNSVRLNPPISLLLPSQIMYPHIVRQPKDEPINPLKLIYGGCCCDKNYGDIERDSKHKLSSMLQDRQL